MNSPKSKRVTIKPKNPNPLFEKWLTEWRDKAKESKSKMQYTFSNALKSLKKYPLPLQTGKDCKILHGFGEKLCKMLDDKLAKYQVEHGNVGGGQLDENVSNNLLPPYTTKSPTKRKMPTNNTPHAVKEYIPLPRTGPFAILVSLYEKSQETSYTGYLSKTEIISNCQKLCNTSFTKPGPGTRYTAWSSMKTLIEKKLVSKVGNPAKFNLTDEGTTLAEKLYIQQKIEEFKELENKESLPVGHMLEIKNSPPKKKGPILKQKTNASSASNPVPSCSTSSFKTISTSSTQSNVCLESVIFAPNSFEIILLVDTQELNGGGSNSENDPILMELQKLNICYEVRNLKVGDYVWICRDSVKSELVLPYIIERKRMDDFGSSIKDNRFHEQKYRLKQCGLTNLIYLVENYGSNEHVGLPLNTLLQAATNTLIQDGFTVKFTESFKGTCEYIACLTNLIISLFKSKTLASCPKEDLQALIIDDDLVTLMYFNEFNKASSKTRHFKVKEMFVRHLLQIKGVSVDKALAVVEKYPTPTFLKLAYEEVSIEQREKLLSSIPYGILKKKLGPVLSKTIYQVFCNNSYS